MDRKTLIILLSAVVIIVCLVFGLSSKDNGNSYVENNNETDINLNYNQVIDETTGETYYQIYNKETGEVIHNVVDEASLQMYIDNPDFIGPENEGNVEVEYNEAGSVKEISEAE